MRKLLGVFATLGVLGAATFAFADGPAATATGKVKSVDMIEAYHHPRRRLDP